MEEELSTYQEITVYWDSQTKSWAVNIDENQDEFYPVQMVALIRQGLIDIDGPHRLWSPDELKLIAKMLREND